MTKMLLVNGDLVLIREVTRMTKAAFYTANNECFTKLDGWHVIPWKQKRNLVVKPMLALPTK